MPGGQNSPKASGQGLGIGFMLVSLTSMQVGNSFAQKLTQQMATPIGAVWIRMAFSGVILLALAGIRWLARRTARATTLIAASSATPSTIPTTATPTTAATSGTTPGTGTPTTNAPALPRDRRAWLFAIAYGAALVTMNSMFYEGISRIPVGIVITIEFLGPLSVAILGSHRPTDFVWVGLAGLGVVILGITPTHLTLAGVLFSLGAGVGWASYILLGSRVARHWQGVGVLTGTCVGGAVVLLPAFLIGGNVARLNGGAVWLGLVVALACTVLPYSLELFALKRLPTGLFAIIESLAPACGALAAWWILGQALHLGDWVAIGCVVAASIGASATAARRTRLATRRAPVIATQ